MFRGERNCVTVSLARQRSRQLQNCARQVQDVASPAPERTSASSTTSLLWSLEKLFTHISNPWPTGMTADMAKDSSTPLVAGLNVTS